MKTRLHLYRALVAAIILLSVVAAFAQQINPELFKTAGPQPSRGSKSVQHRTQPVHFKLPEQLNQPVGYRRQVDQPRLEWQPLSQYIGKPKSADIFYGSGRMSMMYLDSIYFNFDWHTNGLDTTDMDVMITGNEGTNFGNEAWGWPDVHPQFTNPSKLYYLSPYGNLDDVTSVPAVDDPNAVWTTVSWDWNGGNNGASLQPGNLWVIYTRTTHCYVVMEVTEVFNDWNGGSFGFIYKYQPDGSTNFGGEPGDVNFLVNGRESDTLTVGGSAVFTFNFPAGHFEAGFMPIWDANGNGIYDEGDVAVNETHWMYDNDGQDEDPAIGRYQWTFDDRAEGLNRVSESFIYELQVGGTTAYTHLLWTDLETSYAVSGQAVLSDGVTGIHGIVVMVWPNGNDDKEPEEMWIDITDLQGYYSIHLPQQGDYTISSFDYLQMTAGLVPDPAVYQVAVTGYHAGNDFTYILPSCTINGLIQDELGGPVSGIGVRAEGEGPGEFYAVSDTNGQFSIAVTPGRYWVEMRREDLIPNYMATHGIEVQVAEEYPIADAYFLVYQTNATITGQVFLNGNPVPGIKIWSHHQGEFGFTSAFSGYPDGGYTLFVRQEGPIPSLYNIWAVDLPDGMIQVNWLDGIPAGSNNVNIYLVSVTGGLQGYFRDASTNQVIYQDVGVSAVDLYTGQWYSAGPDWETGQYTLWLPNGTYMIQAGGEGYYPSQPDTIFINGALLPYDIYLAPVLVNGWVKGHVSACQNGALMGGVEVQIGNEIFWANTWTDYSGYYEFGLPNGHYYVAYYFYGYLPEYREIDIVNNEVILDVCMNETGGMSSFSGTVYWEGWGKTWIPLQWANVHVYNWQVDAYAQTNEFGQFYFELPDGGYQVEVFASGFETVYDYIELNNSQLTRDYYLNPYNAEGTISGHVYNTANGMPLEGVMVFIAPQYDTLGWEIPTDGNGDFSLLVSNGFYRLKVEHPGFLPFYYDYIWVEQNTVYLDIPLIPADGHILGRVISQTTGQPIGDAWIDAQNLSTGEWFYASTDEYGNFGMPVMNGVYRVGASAGGYGYEIIDSVWVYYNDIFLEFQLRPDVGLIIPPELLSVQDIPNDQGRRVRVVWTAGFWEYGIIRQYSIWRWVENDLWDFVGVVPYTGPAGQYGFLAETLVDSNAYTGPQDSYWSTFVVVAHTNSPDMLLISNVMSGYSIDNLVPSVPVGLVACRATDGVTVTWRTIADEGFNYYAVYRT